MFTHGEIGHFSARKKAKQTNKKNKKEYKSSIEYDTIKPWKLFDCL